MKWPWRGPAISKHFDTALIKKTTTVLSAVAVLVSFSGTAWAASYDQQIAAAKQAAAVAQVQVNASSAKASNYQDQVNQYQSQANAIQAQLNLNQAVYEKVTAQISEAEAKLADQKSILSANIKQMYLDSGVTPLEMLASSQNISDFMNKQQYQDKVKTKIQDAMASILDLKKQLDQQKVQVTGLINVEQTQRAQVSSLLQEANGLLATAQQDANAANQQVKTNNAKASQLEAEQAAILQAASQSYGGSIAGASGGSGGACDNGHGNGGYPSSWCNADQDQSGYGGLWGWNRECASWAGWHRAQIGRAVPTGWGNANTWGAYARAAGYRVDVSPEVGAIAQTTAGEYGHVAVVEAIINGGNSVVVSEMNYDGYGHFRYGTYASSYFNYIH